MTVVALWGNERKEPMSAPFSLLLVLLCFVAENVHAADIEKLVETLKKTAATGKGITENEQKVAEKLQAIGAEAIPHLLPLLLDKNQDIRDLASYTLRDIKGLSEQHLDALIESRRRGDGWIPPAIARIGTPKAVAFIVEELVRERQTGTQVTFAIELLGEKAVPQLVQIYQTEKGWDRDLERTMRSVFKELGGKAKSAIDPLLRIAGDEAASSEKRIHAIAAVGAIGLSAERAVPLFQKLRQHQDAKIQDAATFAIRGIGSAEAAPILVTLLKQVSDPYRRVMLMLNIAELKTRGKSAGPDVAKYLADEDWDVRVGATRALGYIGYEAGADDLIKLLNRVDDWRLVLSAAESLERLKTERATTELSRVSKVHWYPPVREAAQAAIKAIQEGVPVEPKHPEDFGFEFFDFEHAGDNMESLEPDDAKSIQFTVMATPDQPLAITIKGQNPLDANEPQRGVKVEGGYLLGIDHGEFGGGIIFVDSKGNSRVIVEANTEAIYKTAQGIFAVTGLAHLGGNQGLIYKVSETADGMWVAEKWRALPGAPRFSRLLKDGQLFISCYGGIVLVSPSGDMKSLSRNEAIKPAPGQR